MTPTQFEIQPYRERYFDLIARFVQGNLSQILFTEALSARWSDEREMLWKASCRVANANSCEERERRALGKPLFALPSDPRRFPRLLDRLTALKKGSEEFREAVNQLLTAYRHPEMTEGEAKFVNFLPSIPVFERPLPAGSRFRYPCTVEDIRRQLALVPEYDLYGLRAIGLAHPNRDSRNIYGIYRRWGRPKQAPLILLYSQLPNAAIKLGVYNPGYDTRHFRVELSYGMTIQRRERYALSTLR